MSRERCGMPHAGSSTCPGCNPDEPVAYAHEVKALREQHPELGMHEAKAIIEKGKSKVLFNEMLDALKAWVSYLETKRFESATFDKLLEQSRPLIARAEGRKP